MMGIQSVGKFKNFHLRYVPYHSKINHIDIKKKATVHTVVCRSIYSTHLIRHTTDVTVSQVEDEGFCVSHAAQQTTRRGKTMTRHFDI